MYFPCEHTIFFYPLIYTDSHLGFIFVAEVTGKAIEETAAVVVRIYHDRKQKCSMPRISKRY